MRKSRIFILLISILLLSTVAVFGQTTITSVKLNTTNVVLNEGQSESLRLSYCYVGSPDDIDIEWDSENDKIATISHGRIKGIGSGKTRVKAIVEDKEVYCDVTVNADKPVYIKTTQCYTELNKYRTAFNKGKKKKQKIATLKRDAALEKIAKIRVKEMAESGKFSHTRPNGKLSLTLIKGNKAKGENIAKGQTNAKDVTVAWYNSPGHRANMLRKKFKKVGIAAYKYKGTIYWCQIYSN